MQKNNKTVSNIDVKRIRDNMVVVSITYADNTSEELGVHNVKDVGSDNKINEPVTRIIINHEKTYFPDTIPTVQQAENYLINVHGFTI